MSRMTWKVGVFSVAITVGLLLLVGGLQKLNQYAGSSNTGGALALGLIQPAFAQSAVQKSFLEDEAGISAYVKVEQTIDLDKVAKLFRVLEDRTDTYLIGTVELSGYGEDWWPHVWVHKDGWIVVYYPKDEPTSRLMHWPGFRQDQKTITTTTLREVLFSVARGAGVNMAQVESGMHYYHWQYPDATRMLVVVDTTSAGRDSFSYTIPAGLTVYNVSASHYGNVQERRGYSDYSQTLVDGTVLLRGEGGTYILVGNVPESYLTPQVKHTVELRHTPGWTGVALFFLYG